MTSRFVDTAALSEAATRGLRAAFAELRSSHPHETVYGFGFYSDDAGYLSTAAFTEEGLEQVAARYVDRANDGEHEYLRENTLEGWRRQLRWSPADSPHHGVGDEHLQPASAITESGHERLRRHIDGLDGDEADREEDARIDAVYDTLIEVLRSLADEGLFGADRERIVLNLWEGDQSVEDRVAFARRCNPARVAERFEREELASYE